MGDVNSHNQSGRPEIVRWQASPVRLKERQQFGGAANVARIAAGLGTMVGFLPLSQADVATRLRQISHFHMLLPQYDVIVFSEFSHFALDDLNDMVASARCLGKRVLVDLDGSRSGALTGASLMTSSTGMLRHLIGTWHSERELAIKVAKLLSGFECEAFLVNRHDSGISLYLSDGENHFANMVRCDKYYLLAVIAAALKTGIPISAGVSQACDRFDPAILYAEDDMSCQEMTLS